MCQYCRKLLPKRKKVKPGLCLKCAFELWGMHESVLKAELRAAIVKKDVGKIEVLEILLDK